MSKVLTDRTAARLVHLLNSGTVASAKGGSFAGRSWVFVRCDSGTAVGGNDILDQCYPATILKPMTRGVLPPDEHPREVLLTLLGEDGASAVPVEGRCYVALLGDEVESDGSGSLAGRPRCFGVEGGGPDAAPATSCTDYQDRCEAGRMVRYRCNSEGVYEFERDLGTACTPDPGSTSPATDPDEGYADYDYDADDAELVVDVVTRVCPVFADCVQVDGDYQVLDTDAKIVVDASGGAVTLTLPAYTTSDAHFLIVIYDDTNPITLEAFGSEFVNQSADVDITAEPNTIWHVHALCEGGTWAASRGPAGPAPSGTGIVTVSSGVLGTPGALTGDVTTSGAGLATTLATVATAGTTGSSTAIPVVTINAKGLTTGITTAAVVAPAGTLSGATLAAGVTASSLTSVGTLVGGNATAIVDAASDTVAGKIEIATQSEQETGTDTTRAVTPGRQQYHPSAVKGWVYFTVSGTTVTVQASYNVTSVTRNNVGDYTVNWNVDFSSANYCAVAVAGGSGVIACVTAASSPFAAGTARFISVGTTFSPVETTYMCVTAFGDQ